MSEFLNRKENVIDLRLTEIGKEKLADGKFRPVGYEFFDDDILYDVEYAGDDEEQNSIEPRIKETVRLSVSPVPTGSNFSINPLGVSEISTNKYAGWNLRILSGQISDAVTYSTGSNYMEKIPQINLTIREYQNKNTKKIENIESLVIELSEVNGLYQKENFDIEVFEFDGNGEPVQLYYEDEFTNPDIGTIGYLFDIFLDSKVDTNIYEPERKNILIDLPNIEKEC